MKRNRKCVIFGLAVLAFFLASSPTVADGGDDSKSPIIPQLTAVPTFVDRTVPKNGDVNPYGVAFVPEGFPHNGALHDGDIIVSNFNDKGNAQGTGTTIVRVNNDGAAPTVFFQGNQGLGLSTALGVLRRGFVLVGDVPSLNQTGICTSISGPGRDVGAGGLLVINRNGKLVKTIKDNQLLDGPWDLTIKDEGDRAKVFVADAESGTVTRLDLRITGDGDGDGDDHVVVESETQIASGYLHRCDPAAFVVGPTGVALDRDRDILYVASTGDNAIFAIRDASDRQSDAGMGTPVVTDQTHLHGPLGLILAPNGDLISAQGDAVNGDPAQPSEIVEFTREGEFVAQFAVDPAQGGAFGLALRTHEEGFVFAAVDDNVPDLAVWVVH